MLVMSHPYVSSSGTTPNNAIAYDSLPEPRSIVASSHQNATTFPWPPGDHPPPPPPPPFSTASAALLSPNSAQFQFPLPPPPPPAALLTSLYHSSSSFQMRTRRERKSRKQAHELLTEAEKKANHIASEQKRRQNIRMGFDSLIDAVPTLNHGNRSEALILQKSIEHIHYLISVKNELKNQVRDLQSVLGDPYVTLNHDQWNMRKM
ncbi:hypothetical protein [Absidia glauca]|uniref:BHLH domain-containing protein n=1 Tax=Absidia glauca TaxID=4829 RepID=A0A163K0J5_ABSGL|nr:hypothetical protein [Absidia glauca]